MKKKIVLIIALIFALLIGMWIGEKVEKNRKAKERANTSILSTNLIGEKSPIEEIKNIEIKTKIYDVSYVVYSKEFAERFGYPASNVVEMPENVAVMGMSIKTEGRFNNCYLKMLIKKDIGLDVPEISYVSGEKFRFPKMIKDFKITDKEEIEYYKKMIEAPLSWSWMNYYNGNVLIATTDFRYIKFPFKFEGASGGLHKIKEYSKEYYRDYDYFSIEVSINKDLFKQKNIAIWIKKEGEVVYPNKNPDCFKKFLIPKELIKKILPIMKVAEKYSFSDINRVYKFEQKGYKMLKGRGLKYVNK